MGEWRDFLVQRSAAAVVLTVLMVCAGATGSSAQEDEPTPKRDAASQRGEKTFQQACGFCHGTDATGARGPDLVRSPLVAHDVKGNLIGDVIRQGRPDKGMPALPLTEEQVSDIASYLHVRAAESLLSSRVPKEYDIQKLLTGNAEAGKAYFNGKGGCTNCHSVTGDLANVASKYSPIELQAHMLYPGAPHMKTAVVTLPSGEQVKGTVEHLDDFVIGLRDESGWYRSFSRARVKLEVQDRLGAHQQLLEKLSQKDFHDLFAYIATLKQQ